MVISLIQHGNLIFPSLVPNFSVLGQKGFIVVSTHVMCAYIGLISIYVVTSFTELRAFVVVISE